MADCSVTALTGGCPGRAGPRAAARCLHCVRQPVGPAQTVHPWPGCAFRPRPVGESWLPLFVQRCGCSGQGIRRSAFATSCYLYEKEGTARFLSDLVIPVQGGGVVPRMGVLLTDRRITVETSPKEKYDQRHKGLMGNRSGAGEQTVERRDARTEPTRTCLRRVCSPAPDR